jgi:hypothetical protein
MNKPESTGCVQGLDRSEPASHAAKAHIDHVQGLKITTALGNGAELAAPPNFSLPRMYRISLPFMA